jgi:hypothetical protein
MVSRIASVANRSISAMTDIRPHSTRAGLQSASRGFKAWEARPCPHIVVLFIPPRSGAARCPAWIVRGAIRLADLYNRIKAQLI